MNKLIELKNALKKISNKEDAKILQRFFKTNKGEYGEGDIFIGVRVPQQRELVKKYWEMDLQEVETLLKTKIHEYRLTALLILVKKFECATKNKDEKSRIKIFNLYLKNTKHINNWDLVDLSAPNIIGAYLLNLSPHFQKSSGDKPRNILYKLAKSKDLWEKRIAMLSCYTFIKNKETKDVLRIAEILLKDKHDLIHKAVGWMLREIGKRVDQNIEEKFLKKYYQVMPRTMLRYAIEKFDEKKRKFYLTG